ncbi:two-component sensor histidine kinase BarA, partial [Bacillus thuringiensis]|nr:two-component sensor histidine kinase BarA [Bacillus thuringiensis]
IKFTKHNNINILIKQQTINNSQIQIKIQIHNTNINIPKHNQSQLFQTFHQTNTNISHHHSNTKLKLIITQHLIKKINKNISFHNQP